MMPIEREVIEDIYQYEADTYTFTVKADDITFEWAIEGDRIVGQITAPATGWVAVGKYLDILRYFRACNNCRNAPN
jgi:hypothetical protein